MKRCTFKLVISLLCFIGILGTTATGFSAPNDRPVKAKPVSAESKPEKKVLRFDQLMITGETAKPQVFYLLNRKRILIHHQPIKRDLINTLEKTVEGDPF
jgi:hypothetical protein